MPPKVIPLMTNCVFEFIATSTFVSYYELSQFVTFI